MKSAVHRHLAVFALLGAFFAGLVVAGCGDSGGEASPPPDYKQKLAGAPAPLASIYKQGNELLPGGLDAYNERIAGLKGYPIVSNVWASWCGPCRIEFPFFQKAAAKMGKRVAFLGVNSEDNDDAAETFLSEDPLPYPSYTDPDAEIANDIGGRGYPRTAFYDSDGNLTYLHLGQFTDQASLEEAIKKYAIEGQTG
jgi:cytochrome c biogenesis protein CcmG/thiol:disulfide interchange protein DsbE